MEYAEWHGANHEDDTPFLASSAPDVDANESVADDATTERATNNAACDDEVAMNDAADDSALDETVARWRRRGYRQLYRDPYLAQFSRRLWFERDTTLLYLLSGLGALLTLVALITALRRRRWNVVTFVRGPNGRIITAQQRTNQRPIP